MSHVIRGTNFWDTLYSVDPRTTLSRTIIFHQIIFHCCKNKFFDILKRVRTTVMSSCFPSKFCISRRQTLNESLFGSSVHIRDASYSFPVLKCSAVTRIRGIFVNLFCVRFKKLEIKHLVS